MHNRGVMSSSARNDGSISRIATPPDLIKEIIHQIRRIVQAKELYTKELEKKYSVTAAQLNCLLALHEHGPLPPSQIGRAIMVKSSTVTGIIDRLEKKGLAERLRNSPDRRIITVQLTESGKKLADHAPPPIQQKILDGLDSLTKTDTKRILDSLSLLTQMLDAQDLEVE